MRPGVSPSRPPPKHRPTSRSLPETVSRHPETPTSSRSSTLTNTTCRECGRSAAETGTPVFAGAAAFTRSSCLMNGADFPPTCRRCLGSHWDARCEARGAAREGQHSAAASAAREIGSVTESRSVSAVAISSPTGGPTNKTLRRGRPRVDPISKRATAAVRQRTYLRRQRACP